jgi:N utilization substance protein A
VVQELRGEKIDIVPYSTDNATYVCSALSPAKVNRVIMDDESRSMEVIVPDDQLSLAIGKNGQNVRLAVKLTGWKIDVKSESMALLQEEEGHKSLMKIPGVGEAMAERLFGEGFKSIAMIAATDPEMLSSIQGVGEKSASQWIEAAVRIMEEASEKKSAEAGAKNFT